MKELPRHHRLMLIRSLLAGHSIKRSASLTRTPPETVTPFLLDRGAAAWAFHDRLVQHLDLPLLSCVRRWAFPYIGRRNAYAPETNNRIPRAGWAWAAMDLGSGFIVDWGVGAGDARAASIFLSDVVTRLTTPVRPVAGRDGICLQRAADTGHTAFDHTELARLFGPPSDFPSSSQAVQTPSPPDSGNGRADFDLRAMNLHRALSLHFTSHNFMGDGDGEPPGVSLGLSERPWQPEDVLNLPVCGRENMIFGGLV